MVDCGGFDVLEGHEDVDGLAGFASTQGPGVYLVVAAFKIVTILHQDRERYLFPFCVLPVHSHDEGNKAQTLCFGWLNGEEQIIGFPGFKIVNC